MPRQLLASYPRDAGRYDEMFEAPGQARAHWRLLWEQLIGTSPEDLRRWSQDIERQIHENGVTYNVYADPRGENRPWALDPLPLVLLESEWQAIERAVAQRAELLNGILADIYGEQRLVREGRLPPALVFGHPGFLRPMHGVKPPGGIFLHLYAVDLARSPNGHWWVIADRAQAPSGAGYALENRLLISRVFPSLFRDLRVARMAGFFRAMRDSLSGWAPDTDGAPLTVLLTPGPYNETYFEHAFLARYLGYPLVEPQDLTVRDSAVFLKTLGGLRRVHVIMRRVDDEFLDPLELRSDSALGVPGLVQAARLGNVLIANAPGAGIVECAGLLGFLPGLCEHLLGEPLAMPSVATWWCGEPAALEEVIDQLDNLVVKAVFPQLRFEAVFGEDLRGAARDRLITTLRERPHHFVAQELVRLSRAPVIDRSHPRRLGARSIGLRVYAAATPGGYRVMPGGLTRVAGDADVRVLSMQRGGFSKDTWVLSHGPISAVTLLPRAIGGRDLVHSGGNLSSRVAENLFWFGRYAERCDDTARLLRIAIARLIDDADSSEPEEWAAIDGLCRSLGLIAAAKPDEALAADADLVAAVFDEERTAGLAANLRQLQRVAFHLRERMSVDNWRTLFQLGQDLERQHPAAIGIGRTYAFLDRVVAALMTLAGFTLDGMTRDQGWRFLSMGRRIERLQFLCAALRHALRQPAEPPALEWLLDLADSSVTYRSRYMGQPQRLPALDLLMLDKANPRSLIFQTSGLSDYLARIAEQHGPCGQELIQPQLGALERLDLPTALAAPNAVARIDRVLAGLEGVARALSDRVSLRFFEHVSERKRPTYAF